MEDIMKLLKPRTLIVTPHDTDKAKIVDIEKLKQKERDRGYMPIVLEECIKCNVDISIEDIVGVIPFSINNVDRVVVYWLTETEIYNAAVEHCQQTEKEVERV